MSKLIILDAGHGGTDPGAVYNGRKESVDVLKMALKVKENLERSGVTVELTRDKDVFIELKERTDFENSLDADCFVSIHRNAFKPEKAKGVETFCFEKKGMCFELATKVQECILEVGASGNRGVKQSDFYVLKHTKSPAILIELGFIDNTADNNMFDVKFDRYASAIAKGILTTLDVAYVEPPAEVWHRIILDGVQVEAQKELETAKSRAIEKVNAGEGELAKIQRNTDGAWLWQYSKPVEEPELEPEVEEEPEVEQPEVEQPETEEPQPECDCEEEREEILNEVIDAINDLK